MPAEAVEAPVYCPKCGVEYRPGFNECADCRVPLVEEKPPAPVDPHGSDLELVTVLESTDPLLIGLAKDSLEDAEIPFYVQGEELGPWLNTVGSFIHPCRLIQVAADREQEARELLRQTREFYEAGAIEGDADSGPES